MVNISGKPSFLRKLCRLFQRIFDAYASSLRVTSDSGDLVLQLLPLDLVGSKSHLTIPRLEDCTRLAKAIYDKCPFLGSSSSPFSSGSMVQLTEPIPTTIDFKLNASFSFSPFRHNCMVHLGYSWEPLGNWLSATLTNQSGSRQWSASYHLGLNQDSFPWGKFALVVREISAIVRSSADMAQDHSHCFISKTSVFHPLELMSTYFTLHKKLADQSQFGARSATRTIIQHYLLL